MRPFEILSCILAASAIFVLLILPAARRFLVSFWVLLAVALALHAGIEGAHWQLIPLYLSSLVILVFILICKRWPRWASITTGAVCLLLLVASLVLSWLMPMFSLPRPSGPFAVGTRI